MTLTLKDYLAMTPAQKAALAVIATRPAPVPPLGAGKRPKAPKKPPRTAYSGPVDTILILHGRPAPKKNGDMIPGKKGKNGRSIVIPNPQYQAWHKTAMTQLKAQWGTRPALTVPVRLTVTFVEHPRQRFDLAGVFQALCDGLQDAGVIANDRLVRQSGPMVILQDRDNPRIECRLETL